MLLQVASSPMAKTHLLKCPCLSEHTGKLISTNCSRNRRKSIVKMSMLVSNSDKSYPREPNPILQALQEKKQNFKRMASEVGSMASEIRDVRSRLATQEASLSRETACRQVAEAKASSMETELRQLQKNLEERDSQLQTSASVAEQYLRELVDVRSRLTETQALAEASAASAQSAESQCFSLLQELDKKNKLLEEQESRVTTLGRQLEELQHDLISREVSQRQLKEEIMRIEQEITFAVAKAGTDKDCELQKVLNEVSTKNFENLSKHLSAKDEEIARLKEEIKIMSTQWKLKTQDLEAQLDKQRRADQELKKRVLKLEFCLQETRSQTRKLQRIGERRDKTIKELREQLQSQKNGSVSIENPSFWESSGFKFVVSMSMVVLVIFSKR